MSGSDDGARGGLYRRFFAWLMQRMAPDHDKVLVDHKRRLMGGLTGKVVEIGAGTGVNLAYLLDEVRYVAVEPNTHMHPYLQHEAKLRGRRIEIRAGTGERLPVETGSADAVVSTLVLCSVDDVAGVLAEIRRVLKPGGRFVFIEHVAAPAGSRLLRWQGRIRPLWSRLGDGCEPDRDVAAVIQRAGFAEVQLEEFAADLPVPIVRPHIAGVAIHRPPA